MGLDVEEEEVVHRWWEGKLQIIYPAFVELNPSWLLKQGRL